MNLRKSELESLFEEMSLGYSQEFLNDILRPTGRGDVFASRDFIAANAILAELEKVSDQYPEMKSTLVKRADIKKYLHPTTMFRLSSYTPCLAYRFDELKPAEKEELFTNSNWRFTEKQNGVRIWVIHQGGVTKAYSRNYSQKDCSLPEYWGNIAQSVAAGDTFAFDAEVKYEPDSPLTEILAEYGITTDSKLEAISALLQMNAPQSLEIQNQYKERFGKDLIVFRLISVLYYKGVNYKKRTLGEAFLVEDQFIREVAARGVNIKPIRKISGSREVKEAFLSQIIDVEHGEGVVAHNMLGTYSTKEKRDKTVFVKIKRSVSAQASKEGLGDTIDGWVTGFKLGSKGTDNENLVSALEFTTQIVKSDGSVYDHVIAWAPNIERVLKQKITIIGPDGKPTLAPEVYGWIAELSGQNISAVSKRLTHPRIIRFPVFDKSKSDCLFSEEFINSQIDNQSEV